MTVPSVAPERPPACRDEARRAEIVAHPFLNGIDSVEYAYRPADPRPHVLVVRMLRPLVPPDAYGLDVAPELALVAGGTRVRNITALAVRRTAADAIEIDVSAQGDYSEYWLALGWRRAADGAWQHVLPAIDRPFSVAPVGFRPGCRVDFDCATPDDCPPGAPLPAPALDYQAKDYASFRQLLLDLVAQRNPDWAERNPADLGITLLELFAYVGDHLSYFQDAVANEAYLDTARQRVSARRHARLVDYAMHDGRNAWTWVHVTVDAAGTLPMHAQLLTRVVRPLRNQSAPPGRTIPDALATQEAFEADPALRAVRVFQTAHPLAAHPDCNRLRLHAWGNRECCLPRGATSAYVYAVGAPGGGGLRPARRPPLAAGDWLLLEEVRGPRTGDPADADPAHRTVVRLVRVEDVEDPAYSALLDGAGALRSLAAAADPVLPLLKVTWGDDDALAEPLCLTARRADGATLDDVSLARGNVVAADHGRTVRDPAVWLATGPDAPPPRLPLRQAPLTMQVQPDGADWNAATGLLATPRRALDGDARTARPAVSLRIDFATGPELWTPVPTLLDSAPDEQMFVAEVGNDGRATLRFGDDEYGRRPRGALAFTATYRVGTGREGNVGAEALWHVVLPAAPVGWPAIAAVRNPLPATGGTDAETIEEVRQHAPAAFRATQYRAVTEADYAAVARRVPGVAGAVAQFRWTGSWYTVFLGIDPLRDQDLLTLPDGRAQLAPDFADRVRTAVTRARLAGYDLELRTAAYVPLEIAVMLCVLPDHFRADVAEAVRRALQGRRAPDGTRGLFDPARLGFGEPVYLSRLYAAIERVHGVDSAVITTFRRWGRPAAGELESGVLPIGAWEIARLQNDPSAMELGVLTVTARGGK